MFVFSTLERKTGREKKGREEEKKRGREEERKRGKEEGRKRGREDERKRDEEIAKHSAADSGTAGMHHHQLHEHICFGCRLES